MNSQITFHRRPALGALLMVLSASTVLAQLSNVPFKGAFDARSTGGAIQNGTVPIDYAGAGTASLIGRFTYTDKVTLDLASALSSGVIQLVAANGDVIRGSSVGRGQPTDTPNVIRVIELVTITGGTGRFQGATGAFTLDYLQDDTNLPIALASGTLKGTISTPGSPK